MRAKTPPVPANPMSLAEATELIRRLMEKWLASK